MNKNIFLDIIKYSRSKLEINRGVKLEDLKDHLKKIGYKAIDDEGSHENRSLKSCLRQNFHRYGKPEHESKSRYYITPEAYFSSLSHDTYTHSLHNASRSRNLAIWAMVISSFLATASIGISVYELCTR